MTTKANSWAGQVIPVSFESKKKWIVGNIPVSRVRKGPITENDKKRLKRSAVEVVADKSQLASADMEVTISPVGDLESLATIEEIVVTSIGEKGWSVQCDILKTEVESMKKELGSIKKELGLIRARDTIAEVVAVVYDSIKFVHAGHSIKNYGDVYVLRTTLRDSGQDTSALNKAVLSWVSKFIGTSTHDAGSAFDIISRFKSEGNRVVHSRPTYKAAESAIDFYCKNSDDVYSKEKDHAQKSFFNLRQKSMRSGRRNYLL